MTTTDITQNGHGRRYADVFKKAPLLVDELVAILNRNDQLLTSAGTIFESPALQGVVLDIEPVLETLNLGNSLRARQLVGVGVKIKMQELGHETTGHKGPVRSKYFKRAEIYRATIGTRNA